PWFSLFKIKRGDTEYGIGWLPLGGYVKISGMIDESMDKEQMNQPPQPWEFRSKPAWQRLIVMIAGVTVNLILGVVIYSMVIYTWGTEYLPNNNVKYGIYCDSLALKMGLRNGDKIISVDNKVIDDFSKIPQEITLHKAHSIQVMRNGAQQNVVVSEDDISQILKDPKGFISPLIPCQVDSVVPNSGAAQAGLKKGDAITRIDSSSVAYYQDISPLLQKDSNKNVQITIKSGDQIRVATAHIDKDGKLGFMNKSPLDFLQTVKANYGFFASIPAGVNMAVEKIKDYAQSLNVLFTVKGAYKQIGGFITIGKAYSKVWDWERFWAFTGFLSIILAFMNILPIPALDGGHVLFLLYEMATGRKPSEKFMEYAQYTGMLLLLTLMVFANGNDIVKLFHK
ncbi:MAG TPA: RIP metalloprotease RseP, partial [Bacteroidia bacterium]|nr:RIP metalloprotease RseP [Bacteroidia bacterium]